MSPSLSSLLSFKNFKALKSKGLIKIDSFKKNPNKINYVYVLTPKGISKKANMAVSFLKRKATEYEEIKKEIENYKTKN